MKTKILVIAAILSSYMSYSHISADTSITQIDKAKIKYSLKNLVKAVNAGDEQGISDLIAPDNQHLQKEIIEKIAGGINYELDYNPFDRNTVTEGDKVKVTAIFAAAGPGWSANGVSAYFIFQKQEGKWYMLDTDFHKKLGMDYVFDTVLTVFLYLLPFMIVTMAFWIWMLIDCIKREFDDKALWIVLLIFLSLPAAIMYFFMVKRKKTLRKPLEPLVLD